MRIDIAKICVIPALAASLCVLAPTGCVTPEPDVELEPGSSLDSSSSALKVRCSPDRNVTGFYALTKELTVLSNCMRMACHGSSVTVTLTKYVLAPVGGSPFVFSSVQTISPAQQSAVIAAANAWAVANQPPGYFVDYIKYQPDIIVGGSPVYAGIDIIVTYRKCTGSVPPPYFAARPSSGVVATFDVLGETFSSQITNPETIDQAIEIWRGDSAVAVPSAPLVCSPSPLGDGHSFYQDPDSITFGEPSDEACDALPSSVDPSCDGMVSGYCPWPALLIELRDCRTEPDCPVVPK